MRIGRFGLDLDLWLKAWIALQRLVAAMLVLFAHAGFERLITFLYLNEFEGVKKLFAVTVEVALMSLHAWLLIEAVRIFLPEPLGIRLDLDGDDKPGADKSASNI